MKSEARSIKMETVIKIQWEGTVAGRGYWALGFWSFEVVSDFVLRISKLHRTGPLFFNAVQ
jgi:hypothetical protein